LAARMVQLSSGNQLAAGFAPINGVEPPENMVALTGIEPGFSAPSCFL
jgi:hypothetical protein